MANSMRLMKHRAHSIYFITWNHVKFKQVVKKRILASRVRIKLKQLVKKRILVCECTSHTLLDAWERTNVKLNEFERSACV